MFIFNESEIVEFFWVKRFDLVFYAFKIILLSTFTTKAQSIIHHKNIYKSIN